MSSVHLYAYRHVLVGLWLVVFAAFHIAWTTHPAAGFILNGFDLAEQVSIHPGIRAERPPLRTSVFLWLAVPVAAGGLALTANLYRGFTARWMLRGAAGLMALRVIPPENALRAPGNLLSDEYALPLALLTALGVGMVLVTILASGYLLRYVVWVEVGLCLIGVLFPLLGFQRAYQLLHELRLDVGIGAGIVFYVGMLLTIAGVSVRATPATLRSP